MGNCLKDSGIPPNILDLPHKGTVMQGFDVFCWGQTGLPKSRFAADLRRHDVIWRHFYYSLSVIIRGKGYSFVYT